MYVHFQLELKLLLLFVIAKWDVSWRFFFFPWFELSHFIFAMCANTFFFSTISHLFAGQELGFLTFIPLLYLSHRKIQRVYDKIHTAHRTCVFFYYIFFLYFFTSSCLPKMSLKQQQQQQEKRDFDKRFFFCWRWKLKLNQEIWSASAVKVGYGWE